MIRIHNTLTEREEDLHLSDEVKFYLCGPTVYDFIHLGNARPMVFFDAVRRYLSLKHKVIFIQNFTDIDDKIINRAKREGISIEEVSERFIAEYLRDAEALNVLPPTIAPKATEYVEEMIESVAKLIDAGKAYPKKDGIYFEIAKYPEYGALSKRGLQEDADFALWKFEDDSEISWPAPFGRGRPGWHIECSTMINSTAGNVDIHGGGQDLIFPHHENEIAQHESIYPTKLARYWLHNSFIKADDKKMSKSEGNVLTIRELLQKFSGNVIRFFILSTHYRKPISFSMDSLSEAEKGFERIKNFLENQYVLQGGEDLSKVVEELENRFYESMNGDLNTQGAMGAAFEAIREFNKLDVSQAGYVSLKKMIVFILGTLGFKMKDEGDFEVDNLVRERLNARDAKDFKRADEIREILESKGIKIVDGKKSFWKRS